MTLKPVTDAPAPPRILGRVGGVLFDIDDTLVDLPRAMRAALEAAGAPLLPRHTTRDWDAFAALYLADVERFYDRYVAGEFSFAQQRGLRARAVFERLGVAGFDAGAEARWIGAFERAQPRFLTTFDDVTATLASLTAAGVPYGCVTNNVHAYQRAKLVQAGLGHIAVVVGIDTVDAAKPDPAVFHEGCRQLGTDPAATVYVGDNYALDAVGAVGAGLRGVWLNRHGAPTPSSITRDGVVEIGSLTELVGVLEGTPQ